MFLNSNISIRDCGFAGRSYCRFTRSSSNYNSSSSSNWSLSSVQVIVVVFIDEGIELEGVVVLVVKVWIVVIVD